MIDRLQRRIEALEARVAPVERRMRSTKTRTESDAPPMARSGVLPSQVMAAPSSWSSAQSPEPVAALSRSLPRLDAIVGAVLGLLGR